MCLNPYHLRYQTFDGSWRESDVPCGKCPECIRRGQSDLMVLVSRQLRSSRSSNWFVTLSYRDDKLPLAVVWSVYKVTCHNDYCLDPDTFLHHFDYKKDGHLVSRSKPVRLSRCPIQTDSRFDEAIRPRPDFLAQAFDAAPDWLDCVSPSRLVDRENLVRKEYARRYNWNGFDGKSRRCIKPGCVMELSRCYWPDAEHICICTVCTTVDRKDVQLWLKSARVAYEREFGRPFPESMKYIAVQEYGPRGHRPHYHLILTDIGEADLYWLLSRWSREYCGDPRPRRKKGSGVVYDRILDVTEKGNNGSLCAGKYLGLYMKKLSSVEDPAMKAGLCIRPRKVSSKFFGLGDDFEQFRSWALCFDIFGRYDVSDPSTYPDVESLLEAVSRRQYYPVSFNSQKSAQLPIPEYLKRKIYKQVYEGKSFQKKSCRLSKADQEGYCESHGFFVPPYRYEEVSCCYPKASLLSQGLADIASFRADILREKALYEYCGYEYDPLDLPPAFTAADFLSFGFAEFRAKREAGAVLESTLRAKYARSQF